MAANVVVVIENQETRAVTKAVARELGGGQSRSATADHYQITKIIGLSLRHGKYLPVSGQCVSHFKATCGAARMPVRAGG